MRKHSIYPKEFPEPWASGWGEDEQEEHARQHEAVRHGLFDETSSRNACPPHTTVTVQVLQSRIQHLYERVG